VCKIPYVGVEPIVKGEEGGEARESFLRGDKIRSGIRPEIRPEIRRRVEIGVSSSRFSFIEGSRDRGIEGSRDRGIGGSGDRGIGRRLVPRSHNAARRASRKRSCHEKGIESRMALANWSKATVHSGHSCAAVEPIHIFSAVRISPRFGLYARFTSECTRLRRHKSPRQIEGA
jgi:hypothetical protein